MLSLEARTDKYRRHDFANHLHVIRGLSELLIEETPPGPRRDELQQIHSAATAAIDLLEELFPSPAILASRQR